MLSQSRSTISKLNKTTATCFKEMINNTPEKNKMSVVKKIITISSVKQEVKKILMKLIQNGHTTLTEQQHENQQHTLRQFLTMINRNN